MTIDFKEKEILSYEVDSNNPYIGYFSPKGTLIDFVGNSHRDYHNPIAQDFLTYISFVENNELKRGYYNPNEDYKALIEKLNKHIDSLDRVDDLKEFEYQLLLFFRNIYKQEDIFKTMDRRIIIEPNSDCRKKSLLSHLKDICVQYLGYDSIERFNSTGDKIIIGNESISPRLISSTYPNINERYYNYLLMNWEVKRFPRYKYNESTGLYELSQDTDFYENESEETLSEEIKSIKRLIPLQERHNYFR